MPRDLPSIGNDIPQVRAPNPSVSAQQIAQPYLELAQALDKSGESLQVAGKVIERDVAVPAAERAGLQSVSRDADGNLVVDKVPVFGEAAVAFKRATKVAALADGESVARQDDIRMRQEFRDNPEGYLVAAEEYRKTKVKQYTDAAGPEVGVSLDRVIGSQTTQTYKGLLNEHERLTLQRAERSIDAGIASARNDAIALARGGAAVNDPAMQAAFGKIEALTNEKVANPRLAYPKEQADYDLQHLQGGLAANRVLAGIDKIYKEEGADAALKKAESILTDPSLKLTENQRYGYYHKATAEVRANDALRRQDLQTARRAANDAMFAVARGVSIEPELQASIIEQLKASGGQADAARFAASMARAGQLDSFNKLPLAAQTAQIQTFQTGASAKTAVQFFKDKGYGDVAASAIVGHLIQESRLDPMSRHDGGIGFGIAGWNKERLQGLIDFAKARGTSPGDFRTQLEYVDHELRNKESWVRPLLTGAKTPEEATAAFMHFERPAGYTPDRPTAGHGYDNRLRNTREILANTTGAPADQRVVFGPGVDLRLAASMQTSVDKKARATWEKVSRDMDGGQAPNTEELGQVIDAFRLANDHAMLETVAARVDRFEAARQSGLGPLPQQQAMIAEFERRAGQGQLSAGDDAWRRDLITRNRQITTGLEDNPITTTVQNFGDKFRTPGPLNLQDDQQLVAGLAMRGKIAQFAAQNWQRTPVSALDKADVEQVRAVLQSSDPAGKAGIFNAIATALPEDVRNATLAKLGGNEPAQLAQAAAGTLIGRAPDVAQSILRGQQAIATDKRYDPETADKASYREDLDKYLPAATFTLAARTNPMGPYATMSAMVKARYADLSAQQGKTDYDSGRLQQAVTDVTGGVLSHNGGTLIAPTRGMKQSHFDKLIWGMTDDDLAGATTLAGEPISAVYLRMNAQLESAGDGRYFLRLGKDPLRPVYAYLNAHTESPTKYVLDMRGRTPAPFSWADTAVFTGN